MPRYYLSNVAEEDFRQIMQYTLTEWGPEQVHEYSARLEKRLKVLAEFPEIGRKNVNLPEHIFYVVEGKHYLFYKTVDDGIEVVRLLHSKMDIFQNFSESL